MREEQEEEGEERMYRHQELTNRDMRSVRKTLRTPSRRSRVVFDVMSFDVACCSIDPGSSGAERVV